MNPEITITISISSGGNVAIKPSGPAGDAEFGPETPFDGPDAELDAVEDAAAPTPFDGPGEAGFSSGEGISDADESPAATPFDEPGDV